MAGFPIPAAIHHAAVWFERTMLAPAITCARASISFVSTNSASEYESVKVLCSFGNPTKIGLVNTERSFLQGNRLLW